MVFCAISKGNITTFDATGAGTSSGQGTFVTGVSQTGYLGGIMIDSSNGDHGFVRAPNGAITTFDVPAGAQGTGPRNVSDTGTVAGNYIDSDGVSHCFLRTLSGTITTFDPKHATVCVGTAVNKKGIGAGNFVDGTGKSFVRRSNGKITTFAPPGCEKHGSDEHEQCGRDRGILY